MFQDLPARPLFNSSRSQIGFSLRRARPPTQHRLRASHNANFERPVNPPIWRELNTTIGQDSKNSALTNRFSSQRLNTQNARRRIVRNKPEIGRASCRERV